MGDDNSTRRATGDRLRSWVCRNAGLILLAALAVYALQWPPNHAARIPAQPPVMVANGYTAADLLLLAAANLAEERGLAYTALQMETAPSAELRAAIAQKRRVSDEAFREAILLLKTGFVRGSRVNLAATVEYGLRAVNEMREVIDRRSPGTAGQELPRRWFVAASRLIVFTEQLIQVVQIKIRDIGTEPDIDIGLRLQHLALVMSDLAGRERALISGALARREPVPRGVVNVLDVYRGRINRIWRTIASIASVHDLTPELRSIIAELERSYFGELEHTRRKLGRLREAASTYPFSASEWFGRSTKTIRIMIHLGREAGHLARKAASSAITWRLRRLDLHHPRAAGA